MLNPVSVISVPLISVSAINLAIEFACLNGTTNASKKNVRLATDIRKADYAKCLLRAFACFSR